MKIMYILVKWWSVAHKGCLLSHYRRPHNLPQQTVLEERHFAHAQGIDQRILGLSALPTLIPWLFCVKRLCNGSKRQTPNHLCLPECQDNILMTNVDEKVVIANSKSLLCFDRDCARGFWRFCWICRRSNF